MEITRKEIENLFPAVYITLVSMLLGFAVEDVVTQLRELESIDAYNALAAVSIISAIIAVWTGWSFVSMTQKRLPGFLDGANLFVVALCIYALNSTLGQEIWLFYAAISLYMAVCLFSFFYNTRSTLDAISTSKSMRIFRWDIGIIVQALVIYAVAAWMSSRELLPASVELFLVAYYFITNATWLYFFLKAWSNLTRDLK